MGEGHQGEDRGTRLRPRECSTGTQGTQALRKRTNQNATESSTNLELIASVLPDPSRKLNESFTADLDADTEEVLREAVILLLRFIYAEVQTQLESTNQELELLRNAPPAPSQREPTDDPRVTKRREENSMWKLDAPLNMGGSDGKGPLLDPHGRVRPYDTFDLGLSPSSSYVQPLRPFMILPSNAGERARLQAQVFQPGHRLPSMTVDQYLEIEQQRGNIISGGGCALIRKLWVTVD